MLLRPIRSHYPDKASGLNFKNTAASQFGHGDIIFYLFTETGFALNHPLIKAFSFLSTTHSVCLEFLLMSD